MNTILDFKKGKAYDLNTLIEALLNTSPKVIVANGGAAFTVTQWRYNIDNYRRGKMSMDKKIELLKEMGYKESYPMMFKLNNK